MDKSYSYILFRKAGTYLRWPLLLLFLIFFGMGDAFGQSDPTNYVRTDLIGGSPNASSLAQESESFAGSVDFSYNERGWLTKSASAHFTQDLKYNLPTAGATAQYNGNISEQHWGHSSSTPNRFLYSYDPLDRLISGISSTSAMSEVLAYDNMGNITSLTRDGGTPISYTYSGNRLTALSGGISGSYSYDANGNALTDRNGLNYTYNHLNLPNTATKTDTSVSYSYDAQGTKLRSQGALGPAQVQDYVQGLEYTGGTLTRINTQQGYIAMEGPSPVPHYYLSDHLGNVRAVLTPSGSGFAAIQQQDYYPYGLRKALVGATQNPYLYNGKELQGELGGQYDYGTRMQDPVIGRWNVVDPKAHLMLAWSPYVYALNNPIIFIDPDGQFPYTFHVRTFAPTGAFKGTGFHDDGRGFSTSTGVTSRIKQNFTVDPTARTFSAGRPISDPTILEIGGKIFSKTATNRGGASASFGKNSLGSATANVASNFEGSNPFGFGVAPNIEVSSALSITENLEKGQVIISFDLSSKQFPATEGFVQDAAGNSVFLGGAAAYGNALNLANAGKKQVSTIDLIIGINDKGIFQTVTIGGTTYSLDDFNDLRTSKLAGPFPREDK